MLSNKYKISLILLLALFGAIVLSYNKQYKLQINSQANTQLNQADKLIGQKRPDFTLPDRLGIPYNIGEWDGKVLVINFWATWCRPCRKEMPMFYQLQQDYQDKGLQFLGIAIDDKAAVDAFFKQTDIKVNYPILIGDDEAIPIAKDYDNEFGVLPYSAIIGRQGMVKYLHYGEINRKQIEEKIAALL